MLAHTHASPTDRDIRALGDGNGVHHGSIATSHWYTERHYCVGYRTSCSHPTWRSQPERFFDEVVEVWQLAECFTGVRRVVRDRLAGVSLAYRQKLCT